MLNLVDIMVTKEKLILYPAALFVYTQEQVTAGALLSHEWAWGSLRERGLCSRSTGLGFPQMRLCSWSTSLCGIGSVAGEHGDPATWKRHVGGGVGGLWGGWRTSCWVLTSEPSIKECTDGLLSKAWWRPWAFSRATLPWLQLAGGDQQFLAWWSGQEATPGHLKRMEPWSVHWAGALSLWTSCYKETLQLSVASPLISP